MPRLNQAKRATPTSRTVWVYVTGSRRKVPIKVAVATPSEIWKSLKLSPASVRRIRQALAQARPQLKAG